MTNREKPTVAILLKSEVGQLNNKNIAGTERIFINDLNCLRKHQYQVKAFARFSKPTYNIKKLYFPLFLIKLSRVYSKRIGIYSDEIFSLLYLICKIIYSMQFIIKTRNYDLLIGYTTPILSIFQPSKSIIIMQNEHRFPLIDIFKKHYKNTLYLYCSKSLYSRMVKTYPQLQGSNAKILYNAVDTKLFKPQIRNEQKVQKKVFKLLYCSAWSPEKGIHILLNALLLIPKSLRKSISLTISSNERLWYTDFPQDEKKFKDEVKRKISIYKNVNLLQGVSYSKMPLVYSNHDLLIFPSLWEEPFGLVVLEAIACGLSLIAFKSGAIDEITSSTNSILLENKSARTLSKAILEEYNKFNSSKSYHLRYESKLTEKNHVMLNNYREKKLISYLNNIISSRDEVFHGKAGER